MKMFLQFLRRNWRRVFQNPTMTLIMYRHYKDIKMGLLK
jgi:hypothetical protein